MIARVKIAPVERWCEETDPRRDDGEVGLEIEIETSSMVFGRNCPGRSWLMNERSSRRLQEVTGLDYDVSEIWICEHMLEMD